MWVHLHQKTASPNSRIDLFLLPGAFPWSKSIRKRTGILVDASNEPILWRTKVSVCGLRGLSFNLLVISLHMLFKKYITAYVI